MIPHLIPLLVLTVSLTSTFNAAANSAAYNGPCENQIAQAAKRHSVPIPILHAIGLTESGRKNKLHPYALNVHGETHFPNSKREAKLILDRALRRGKNLVDIGCMQINYKYHFNQFSSLDEMFSPSKNVDYAARFLKQLKRRHGTWVLAVARYHAGKNNVAAQKKYICKVLDHMFRQGTAKPTLHTKKLCNTGH